jgi:hypothetical protein
MMDTTFLQRNVAAALGTVAGRSFTFNGSSTLDYIYATLVTSATVGNRQLEFRMVDAKGNVIFAIAAGAVQAASLTRSYVGAPGTSRETAFLSTQLCFLWPEGLEIPNGGTIQILDTANIDAAADTLAVNFGVRDDG